VEEKRRIVEQTLRAGASVTVVARAHGVNRDQVFHWRRQYREGRLVALPAGRRGSTGTKLLRVRMAGACAAAEGREVRTATLPSGTMQIELAAGTLRLTGRVDGETLRVVLEALRA
jgi:transposase